MLRNSKKKHHLLRIKVSFVSFIKKKKKASSKIKLLKEDNPQRSILGDGAVDVGYDDSVVPVPQVDGSFTATGALVLCGDAERHVIRPLLQLQVGLKTRKQNICEGRVQGEQKCSSALQK